MEVCILNNELIIHQKDLEEAEELVIRKKGKVKEIQDKINYLNDEIKKLED